MGKNKNAKKRAAKAAEEAASAPPGAAPPPQQPAHPAAAQRPAPQPGQPPAVRNPQGHQARPPGPGPQQQRPPSSNVFGPGDFPPPPGIQGGVPLRFPIQQPPRGAAPFPFPAPQLVPAQEMPSMASLAQTLPAVAGHPVGGVMSQVEGETPGRPNEAASKKPAITPGEDSPVAGGFVWNEKAGFIFQ